MDFESIRCEVADHALTITLDRPERLNAFTEAMGAELIEAFDRADRDDEVRAVIVTGAGRGFCAGMDLQAGGTRSTTASTPTARFRATAAAASCCASTSASSR